MTPMHNRCMGRLQQLSGFELQTNSGSFRSRGINSTISYPFKQCCTEKIHSCCLIHFLVDFLSLINAIQMLLLDWRTFGIMTIICWFLLLLVVVLQRLYSLFSIVKPCIIKIGRWLWRMRMMHHKRTLTWFFIYHLGNRWRMQIGL